MANTSVIRLAGLTNAIAVTSTSSTALTVDDNTNDQINYATFLNVGTKPCAVKVASGVTTTGAIATAPAS